MKRQKKITVLGIVISLALSATAYAGPNGPAIPTVPVGERTSNLAGNQNFVDWWRIGNANTDAIVFYDMYGNHLRNARLAGGEVMTNDEGFAIWNGITIDGVNAKFNGYMDSMVSLMMTRDYGWRQNLERPVNENGVSNWYYKGNCSLPSTCSWQWLSDQDNVFSTKKAYCFNEEGYLYVNTITPDGFIVNEHGQMITEDGTLVEHEYDALTHDKMNSAYIGASIGFMRQKYFTVCIFPECNGLCFTGANEKLFSAEDRPSQYTYEEYRQKISDSIEEGIAALSSLNR